MGEVERVFSRGAEKLVRREGHGLSVEDAAGCVDEGDDEKQLERIDDVVAELRSGNIEAEDEGQGEAEDGGAADDGIDADQKARGDAPGQLFGRGSHAMERVDRKRDAAVEPVVVHDGRAMVLVGAICFSGGHF